MKDCSLVLVLGCAALLAKPPEVKTEKPSGLELQRISLKKQRDSLRQQLGVKLEKAATDSDYEFLFPPTLTPEIDCPALEEDIAESLITSAAKRHSLQPQLIRAVMRQESGFKPCAISTKGAQGLMQLMPSTASRFRVSDPFEPGQNVEAGAAFLKELIKKYNGDLRLALVAYNAGALRADQLDPSKYPLETQAYLANIFAELGTPSVDKPKNEVSDPLAALPPTPLISPSYSTTSEPRP